MHQLLGILLVALPAYGQAPPRIDCRALDAAADTIGVVVPDVGSGRDIAGRGRAQLYSAPDRTCRMPGVFVRRGDELYAQIEHNGFTRVAVIPRNDRRGSDTIAWVRTARLKGNGRGIVPGAHSF